MICFFTESKNVFMKMENNAVKLHTLQILSIITVILLYCRCGGDHQIIFPQAQTQGIINGYISPAGVKAKVFLENVTVVDSLYSDFKTGYFEFRNVDFGSYKLIVKADSFGTVSTVVRLSSGIYTLGSVTLSRYPNQIIAITPIENSIINYDRSSVVNDSIVEFSFSFKKP
ncbi:MAG TPA: hypothetical protein VHO70_11555, partial [Chitinispirillaceae bacterium]|nr:hypothetical protein [Chitinispirillaceae bacterium]